MASKIESLNPSETTFTFRMDEYDCYALRTGLCSLYLSDEEAAAIDKTDKVIGNSNVMYCRVLKNTLLDVNYYENPKFQSDSYSIRIHERSCGHYVFTDGQHRSCIAKHLNLQKMYVNLDRLGNYIPCNACHEKINKKKEKKLFPSFLSMLRKKEKPSRKTPYHFIDKEYIIYKKQNESNTM